MILQGKLDRAMKWLKDQNKKPDSGKEGKEERDENALLEKKDIPALILSVLCVFGPILLVLLAIALWACR